MKKMLIVFDMDGTLVDTRSIIIDALNNLAHSYNYDALDGADVRELRATRSIKFLKVLGISLWKAPFVIRGVQKILYEKIEKLDLVEGMPQLLLAIKSKEILLGVATSNSKKNADLFFEKFRGKYFDFRHSGIMPFMKHRALKRIAKNNEISVDCIYYIGDETRDIMSAKRAGVKVIAVTWGFNSRDILESLSPDFIADSPREILTYLESKGWKLCT